MFFPFGQTVVVTTRVVAGQDSDGNDAFTPSNTTLTNVPVWPKGASEDLQGRDLATTDLTALLPLSITVSLIDAITVYGAKYEVDGEPERFQSPFTDLNPGVLVNLKKVTG